MNQKTEQEGTVIIEGGEASANEIRAQRGQNGGAETDTFFWIWATCHLLQFLPVLGPSDSKLKSVSTSLQTWS